MTWTRTDDGWTEDAAIRSVSHEARWHYLCLIHWCSRAKQYDGMIPIILAQRLSDVSSPEVCLEDLGKAGLIEFIGGHARLLRINEHVPPTTAREKSTERTRRHRKHVAGDHSECRHPMEPETDGTRSEHVPEHTTGTRSTTVTKAPKAPRRASGERRERSERVPPGQDGTGRALRGGNYETGEEPPNPFDPEDRWWEEELPPSLTGTDH